ncbi:uncharacterized protein LOC144376327 isoform X2 [Ictidomys tridecemlineatus]
MSQPGWCGSARQATLRCVSIFRFFFFPTELNIISKGLEFKSEPLCFQQMIRGHGCTEDWSTWVLVRGPEGRPMRHYLGTEDQLLLDLQAKMDTQRLRKLSGLALGFYCCSVAEARHLDSKFTALSTESNCCAYGSGRKSRMTTLSLMEAEESSSIFNPEWSVNQTESLLTNGIAE